MFNEPDINIIVADIANILCSFQFGCKKDATKNFLVHNHEVLIKKKSVNSNQ